MLISIDAMGGDAAPEMVVEGAALAAVRRPDMRFVLHGDEARVRPLVDARAELTGRVALDHAAEVVEMDDKPAQALRRGRGTSMWRAIHSVRAGECAAVVSAGNTGALMAMAKFQLRTIPGVDRPAIAAIWPTIKSDSILLDAGANVECDARNLIEFALMGAQFARVLLGVERPLVGLLNIGAEDVKGNDEVKGAAAQLRARDDLPFIFHGFVEGDDIGKGVVDVVVTDGFTGNIALKTAEGTARQIAHYLRAAFSRSLTAKIGYAFARGAMAAVRARMDPRAANGGVFLGLNGVVVKSHGGADATSFASAIELAGDMLRGDMVSRVAAEVARISGDGAVGAAPGARALS